MRLRLRTIVSAGFGLLSLASGCWLTPEEPAPADVELELPAQPLPLEGSPTAYGMLRVVNELDFPSLDDDVGLDRQAAASILAHRAGPDEYLGTPDDRFVEDLAQLDALYWLGEENLWRIQAFALLEGWVPEAVPQGCEPALAQALHECRGFVAEALAEGDAVAAADASWSCVEARDEESPAAGFFAQAGIVGYREPALGYHALLCADAERPLCALGVAGLAEHTLPECVAAEG